jgi:hypothetical protein
MMTAALWLAILALLILFTALRKSIHDLEDIVAGMEERFNRRLRFLEENQKFPPRRL